MKKIQDFIYFFIVVILIAIVAYQGQKIEDYKKSESIIEGGDIYKSQLLDSISLLNIDLGRYQVALDNLKDKDSAAAQKFENELYIIE
jgi:hypothetical protein